MPRLPPSAAAACFLAAWLGYFTALQWSVVRYRLGIVVVLTSATVLLAVALGRRWRLAVLPRPVLAAALVVSALVAEGVPFFSHATSGDRRLLAHVVAGAAVLCAAAVAFGGRRAAPVALAVAAAGVVAWTALAVALVPAPKIDVWVTLQQAADGLAHGRDAYTMVWHDSPGIQDAFTYLPWTSVLVAPGRWLAGDVRWALLVALLVALACTAAMGLPVRRADVAAAHAGAGRGGGPHGSALVLSCAAAALLALAPGSVTQAEQAWTEPLLFACLAGWALLVRRGHPWWAVLPLALGCASKQHLALLLPVLACWPTFGWRRTVATGGVAGALVLPWFVASPSAMWHDTVGLLVTFHPIRFADTWFIASLNELGRTPPFWLTGIVVLAVLGAACWAVHRRRPDLPELLGWLALLLLVANLVNKQAFYNQFWLVGALVALAVAASGASSGQPADQPADEPRRGATS